MTTQDKAKDLFDKYFDLKWQTYDRRTTSIKSMTKNAAKQCALIAVTTILNARPAITDSQIEYQNYWQSVKTEIEKL
jgi:hypothetical protein